MRAPLKAPLVSVIVPVHNAEAYVGEALDSILSQDYPSVEVIAVDDGSCDGTATVLARYQDRVHAVSQPNQGAAAARNRGLALARGDYLAFLDGDDVWLPGKLTAQIAYMERHPGVDLTYGRWAEWRREADGVFRLPAEVSALPAASWGAPPAVVREDSGWLYHRLLTGFLMTTIAVVMRRRLFERIGGFDDALPRGEDYDYWLRASRETEIHKLDRVMALYRQHATSTTYRCPERNYAACVIERACATWGRRGPDGSEVDPAGLRRHIGEVWAAYAIKQLGAGLWGGALRSLGVSVWSDPPGQRHCRKFLYAALGSVKRWAQRNLLLRRGHRSHGASGSTCAERPRGERH